MSELEASGYKGHALQLLKAADCNVGDILKITSKDKSYEGILIPRFGEGQAIIIKMKLRKYEGEKTMVLRKMLP